MKFDKEDKVEILLAELLYGMIQRQGHPRRAKEYYGRRYDEIDALVNELHEYNCAKDRNV